MAEITPRRLRRFQRQQQSELEGYEEPLDAPKQTSARDELEEAIMRQPRAEKKALEIAVKQVKEFKEKHQRLPRKDEYDRIAENIYSQLRDKGELSTGREIRQGEAQGARGRQGQSQAQQKPQQRGRTKAARMGAKEQGQAPNAAPIPTGGELRGLEIKDILKQKTKETEKMDEENEEDFLKESEEDNEKDFSLSELDTDEEGTAGTGKCPNCGKPIEEIIFCPECGSGFCEQCAKIERIGSEKKIVCPKCKKTIKK